MKICQICYGISVRLASFSFILGSRDVLPVPDHSHEARHRASHRETSRRPATSRPGRLIAGLALPTAATVALVFCAAGAAVATTSTSHSAAFIHSAEAMASPRAPAAAPSATGSRYLEEVEQAQAVAKATSPWPNTTWPSHGQPKSPATPNAKSLPTWLRARPWSTAGGCQSPTPWRHLASAIAGEVLMPARTSRSR
jgi:hypothetical protein